MIRQIEDKIANIQAKAKVEDIAVTELKEIVRIQLTKEIGGATE